MTPKEIADQLTGVEYGRDMFNRVSAVSDAATKHGIVIAYGASDDLMEFDGAILDEVGVYNGNEILLTSEGLLRSFCDEGEECPNFEEKKAGASKIKALWCAEPGYLWTYETTIPHATFEIIEEGQPYGRGIVFRLADAGDQARRDELLTICEELAESAAYWSEYDVPLGIVDRLNAAIASAKGQQ